MNREAAAHLEFFLEKQTKATPKQIAEVKKSLDKVLPKVAKLTVLPSPDDSDVFVDDVLVGRGRQTVFLNPGDARIGAAKDGQSISKTVSVKAGEVIGEYRIEVPKEPTGQGGAGGAGAGGAAAGGAGGAGEGAGGAGAGGSGGGPAGEDAPVWPTFVLAGVGVASLGLGVTFTALSTQKASEIDEATRCPDPVSPVCLQDVDDLRSSGAGFQVGAIVGFVVGGLAGAGALTYALVSTSDDTPGATVTMLPRFGLDSAGFSVLGSF
jgi:PPE-repeat protein